MREKRHAGKRIRGDETEKARLAAIGAEAFGNDGA
jgi:hypothetical protein